MVILFLSNILIQLESEVEVDHRFLSEGLTNPDKMSYIEDIVDPKRPPEEFYAFVRYRKSTRLKLIKNNQDMYIASGQNWLFALLVIFTYCSVWLLQLGLKKATAIRVYIKIQRIILQSFFIKFQFITFTELALHDITIEQPLKYKLSYALSIIFQQIVVIEIIRAYYEISQNYTLKQIESKYFNTEKIFIIEFWTKGLEIENKNTKNINNLNKLYFVRERLRWSIIQIAVVGLQSLPRVQISFITLVDLIYVVLIMRESAKNRIFKSIWLKIKHLCQEVAILVFLVVLTIFSFTKTADGKQSKTMDNLEILVIVAVSFAMACEIILMIYTIFDAVRNLLTKKKVAEQDLKKEEITIEQKKLKVLIEEEPVAMRVYTNKHVVDDVPRKINVPQRSIKYIEPLNCEQEEPKEIELWAKISIVD